jgi:hypothetical protein
MSFGGESLVAGACFPYVLQPCALVSCHHLTRHPAPCCLLQEVVPPVGNAAGRLGPSFHATQPAVVTLGEAAAAAAAAGVTEMSGSSVVCAVPPSGCHSLQRPYPQAYCSCLCTWTPPRAPPQHANDSASSWAQSQRGPWAQRRTVAVLRPWLHRGGQPPATAAASELMPHVQACAGAAFSIIRSSWSLSAGPSSPERSSCLWLLQCVCEHIHGCNHLHGMWPAVASEGGG